MPVVRGDTATEKNAEEHSALAGARRGGPRQLGKRGRAHWTWWRCSGRAVPWLSRAGRAAPREEAGASPAAGEEEDAASAAREGGLWLGFLGDRAAAAAAAEGGAHPGAMRHLTARSEWRPDLIIITPISLRGKKTLGCCFQLCSSSPSFRPSLDPH